MTKDRLKEKSIVAQSIEESALRFQITSAENRAMQRCKQYNNKNIYWKQVDNLMKDQQAVMLRIRNFNIKLTEMTKESEPRIISFLNEHSPEKDDNRKRSHIEITSSHSSEESLCDDGEQVPLHDESAKMQLRSSD